MESTGPQDLIERGSGGTVSGNAGGHVDTGSKHSGSAPHSIAAGAPGVAPHSIPAGAPGVAPHSITAGAPGHTLSPVSSGCIGATAIPAGTNSRPLSVGGKGIPASLGTNNDNVSAGAAAGIGVGCAVVGALIASLIFFVIMRRSRGQSRSRQLGSGGPMPSAVRKDGDSWVSTELANDDIYEKTPSTRVYPIGVDAKVPALEHILPQPVDTSHISTELSTLCSLIRNHLNNFYKTSLLQAQDLESTIDQQALVEIAKDTPFDPKAWIGLLASNKTRANAIRFILGWVIFSRIDPECSPAKTLLPPGIAACFKHMSNAQGSEQDADYIQSRWRMMTSFLLRDQYVRLAFEASDDRLNNLQDTVRLIDAVLRPLGVEALHGARVDNLTEILKRAAAIGFTLASQPSAWIFDWEASSGNGQTAPLVLFPSLVQCTDENGQKPQGKPLEIGEKELGHTILIS